jgi:hypothetical protein
MVKNKFKAILAKNDIARELKRRLKDNEPISINFIIQQLKDIELYLGESNQPSISSILNSDLDI